MDYKKYFEECYKGYDGYMLEYQADDDSALPVSWTLCPATWIALASCICPPFVIYLILTAISLILLGVSWWRVFAIRKAYKRIGEKKYSIVVDGMMSNVILYSLFWLAFFVFGIYAHLDCIIKLFI